MKVAISPCLIMLCAAVAAFAISGCGGGGGGDNRGVTISATRITVSGTAVVPVNSGLTRPAGESASRVAYTATGLDLVDTGTAVGIYIIDDNGNKTGDALVTGTITNGRFALELPEYITKIPSDMIVSVSSGSEEIRAFITTTTDLMVDPYSEYVVRSVASDCAPISNFSHEDLGTIYESTKTQSETENISFFGASDIDGAEATLGGTGNVNLSVDNQVRSAGGSCGEWSSDEGEEEDAFGNIMNTTFAYIDGVGYSAPGGNQPCTVKTRITHDDGGGKAWITSVKIIYYLNGDFETPHETTMSYGTDGLFTGTIPGQSTGTKVDFIIRVEDSNGNVTSNAISRAEASVAAIPDIDNSPDIVADNADLLGFSAGYDDSYLYVDFNVQGIVDGGTVDPPYIMMYGIKVTNPDAESGEGLMVGKLWLDIPLLTDKTVQDTFIPTMSAETVEQIGRENIDKIVQTGLLVVNIQKLMGGNLTEGLRVDAEPEGTATGGAFSGKVKIATFGDNPSGYLRIIILTAANASLDAFMPIPQNCTHFLTIYRSSYGYTVH